MTRPESDIPAVWHPRLNIVGRGNVGTHLAKAFTDVADVTVVDPRTLTGLDSNADFTIICVSDNAVSEVSGKLDKVSGIMAHTSGSVPLSALPSSRRHANGVFYPLQTFSRDIALDYSKIPVFIEGGTVKCSAMLEKLARLMSENVRRADSDTRRRLHLASVIACNFTNHLYSLAEDILKREGIGFDALAPLITETARKAALGDPAANQTGPARRGDTTTINRHLDMLAENPGLREIYRLLSDSITNRYK